MAWFPIAPLSFILYFVLAFCLAEESAWNGQSTSVSNLRAPFTPYYVPPGAKGYDSTSPFIHYSGKWYESFSKAYVGDSIYWTVEVNATITFTFTGTGIEWFGNIGPRHGISNVYIDGLFKQTVDTWDSTFRKQQRNFWMYNLPFDKHTLKIVNTGKSSGSAEATRLDIDALVVTKGFDPYHQTRRQIPETPPPSPNIGNLPRTSSQWGLVQKGSTGVAGMQLAIISDTHAIIIDKVEHNLVTISGHPAWGVLYNLNTHAIIPLDIQSNSFCAGGTFLSNGTLINVGGNPVVDGFTSSGDFGDLDGLQAIRIFEPCNSDSVEGCYMYENHARIRMASPRWYSTTIRMPDGSAMIIGGSTRGGWINNATVNNPTFEFFPPKAIHGSNGLPISMQFLVDTLNSNLFPIAFVLPDGTIFVAANQDAMIYNLQTNTERRLPSIPNGVRVTYPMTGTGLLLPLTPENNYVAEILLCGGSTIVDEKPGYEISSQDPASAQCSRLVLTEEGISNGWIVEQMPQARTMADGVLLPTGDIVVINGAGTGISGYGNVIDQIGASNAANPVLTPVLYSPVAPIGQRFSSGGMPTSNIPRLYHSVATLTPNGDIMVAGSNPNLDRSEVEYGTEYRVEWVQPPYMTMERPTWGSDYPSSLGFGQVVRIQVTVPIASTDVKGTFNLIG